MLSNNAHEQYCKTPYKIHFDHWYTFTILLCPQDLHVLNFDSLELFKIQMLVRRKITVNFGLKVKWGTSHAGKGVFDKYLTKALVYINLCKPKVIGFNNKQ